MSWKYSNIELSKMSMGEYRGLADNPFIETDFDNLELAKTMGLGTFGENDYDEFSKGGELDTLAGNINANRMKKVTKQIDEKQLKTETIIFNTDRSDALRGIVEETPVTNIFFSPQNIKSIQDSIRYYVFKITQERISNQDRQQLHILMRSIILQYGNLVTPEPIVEVKRLNQKVIDKCTQSIIVEMKQYTGYIKDLEQLPVPMDNPHYVNKNNFTYDMSNLPQ